MAGDCCSGLLVYFFLVHYKNEGLGTLQMVVPEVGQATVQIPNVKSLILGYGKRTIGNRVTCNPEVLWLK